MNKSIIKYRHNIEIVDDEKRHDYVEVVEEQQEWCCQALKNSNFDINDDGTFGETKCSYDEWGDIESEKITSITNCPFCGKKIEVMEVQPKIRKGHTAKTTKYTPLILKTTKYKGIKWDGETGIDKRQGYMRTSMSQKSLTFEEYSKELDKPIFKYLDELKKYIGD